MKTIVSVLLNIHARSSSTDGSQSRGAAPTTSVPARRAAICGAALSALALLGCGGPEVKIPLEAPQRCARPYGHYAIAIQTTFSDEAPACLLVNAGVGTRVGFGADGRIADLGAGCRATYSDDNCDFRVTCASTWNTGALDIAVTLASNPEGTRFYGLATLQGTGSACPAAAGVVEGWWLGSATGPLDPPPANQK